MQKVLHGPLALAIALLGLTRPCRALLRDEAHNQVAQAVENPDEAFAEWASRHKKVYSSDAERAERAAVWRENLDFIQEYNAKGASHWLGLGPFTDMTLEEFNTKARAGGVSQSLADARSVGNEMRLPHARDVSSLPEEVDWYAQGAVTEPRDQGACGSCWAFAAVSTIESVNQIFTGDLLDLSEQELVDCDGSNYGCDGGWPSEAFLWVEHNGGIDVEKDYPYRRSSYRDSNEGMCDSVEAGYKEVTIDGMVEVPYGSSVGLHHAVAEQPVVVAINTADAPGIMHYAGGVFDGACSTNIDHAVVVVGYGTDGDSKFWKVKNSWSTMWGEGGFIRMARSTEDGEGFCGIQMYPAFPLKVNPNPPPPAPTPDLDPDAEPVVCNFFSSCKGGTSCCCDFKMYGLCLNWTCCINGYSACGRRRCELIEGSDLEADAELEVPAMSSITGNPVQQL